MTLEFETMMVRARIDIALFALKSVFILNGGAALATMVFAGQVIANELTPQSLFFLDSLIFPLLLFTAGLVFSSLASLSGYISQSYFSNDYQIEGIKLMNLTVSLALGSVILFAGGVVIAVYTLASVV